TPISSVINVDYNYQRASAYGVPGDFIEDGNDLLAVYNKFVAWVDYVRNGNGPVLVESLTYRRCGHSTSDPGKYRTKQEVDEWKKKDPILKQKRYLIDNNLATEEELNEIDRKSLESVEASVKFALESPEPTLESA